MSLADLIRGKPEGASRAVATMTLATVATHGREPQSTVASVATVTVADPPNEEISTRWRMIEGDSVREITVWPAESRATMQARYPGSVANPAPWPTPDPESRVIGERDAELLQAQSCAKSGLASDPEAIIAGLSPQEAVDAALALLGGLREPPESLRRGLAPVEPALRGRFASLDRRAVHARTVMALIARAMQLQSEGIGP